MGRCAWVITALLVASLTSGQGGQGGVGGGGFGGGGQGGGGFGGAAGGLQGGGRQAQYDRSVAGIEAAISRYLDGDEIKNILTPGEYSEWPLTMKEGQVVIAEARSDAFDPALEVVDDKGKVLATNDDRYPGDQRPLLLWRCEKAGAYSLRGRCFRDKAGGQFFLKSAVYDSMELRAEPTEREVSNDSRTLLRIPMKRGDIQQVITGGDTERHFYVSLNSRISPIGLPQVDLAQGRLEAVAGGTLLAPVDGDYYVLATVSGGSAKGLLRAWTRKVEPMKLAAGPQNAKAATGAPVLWSVPVKNQEMIRATVDLDPGHPLVVVEEPDLSKYDLKTPETNPFFPQIKKEDAAEPVAAFASLPGRARDDRVVVLVAQRDARLWFAADARVATKQCSLNVAEASREFAPGTVSEKLSIGNIDYWAFEAKVGDVLRLSATSTGFAEQIVLRGPELDEMWTATSVQDKEALTQNFVIPRPGRYLVAVSCLGDGGSGDYTLTRTTFSAREFKKGSPATGVIEGEQVQVWKFTATYDDPILLHLHRTGPAFSISVYDDKGGQSGIPLSSVGKDHSYGVLKIEERSRTYVLVFVSTGGKSQYTLELLDLPGFPKR